MLFLTSGVGLARAQAPEIQHVPIPCVAPGAYPVIDAVILPGADIRTAKVYFRSNKYSKFYYLEMAFDGTAFSTALPKPSLETEEFVYYIEAVDVTFNNSIGDEHVAEIRESCQAEGPSLDEAPELLVGATESGVSASPPGFQTVGIVGSITSAGVVSALSGGSGIGAAVVVGGVAAAGGVVVAAANTKELAVSEPEPSAPVSALPPLAPPPPSAPVPPEGPGTPSPPNPTEPEASEPNPPEEPVPSSPVRACFTGIFPGGSCNLKLESSCSTGPITSYRWAIDASPALGGSSVSTEASVNRNFPGCAGEEVAVSLTVGDGSGSSDSRSDSIQLPVSHKADSDSAPVHTSATSLLRGDGIAGRVVLNDARLDATQSMVPFRHDFLAGRGENHIEAFLSSPTAGAVWEFDFSSARHFVPGSLRSAAGQTLLLSSHRIVFRLNGTPEERLRFSFELDP